MAQRNALRAPSRFPLPQKTSSQYVTLLACLKVLRPRWATRMSEYATWSDAATGPRRQSPAATIRSSASSYAIRNSGGMATACLFCRTMPSSPPFFGGFGTASRGTAALRCLRIQSNLFHVAKGPEAALWP